jgi:hypothetical protein
MLTERSYQLDECAITIQEASVTMLKRLLFLNKLVFVSVKETGYF